MKSHTKIFLFITLDRWQLINSVNHLCVIINKTNRCIEESNGNKYLTLVSTDERRETVEKYEELWNKIRDLIRSITDNSDNYDEKYMKIKSNSDDDLSLKKTLEIYNRVIVNRPAFHEGNKYYSQFFLDKCIN